jgi:hypothetical protein
MTITVRSLLEIVLAIGVLVGGAVILRAYCGWRKDRHN